MFHRILVCSDGSERSLAAAELAANLAKQHRSRLTLLHVCHIPLVERPFPGAPSLAGPALDTYVQEMHAAVIERTLPVIEQQGINCDIVEAVGTPAEVIARTANHEAFDLLVLGSRGVSTEKAEKVGSVCHQVLHDACCPVLVVR